MGAEFVLDTSHVRAFVADVHATIAGASSLAWGLVGLYRGTQDEEIYAAHDGALELLEQRSLRPGDFYVLIPPRDDIHRARTTSAETSVSIHLLTNDTGCVWRHAYDPTTGEASPFRSGYVNAPATTKTNADHSVLPLSCDQRTWPPGPPDADTTREVVP